MTQQPSTQLNTRFSEIYANNEWGYGSGEGSLPIHTGGYAAFLETFLREQKIGSVVDMGCGDWQFSQFINWGHANYTGFDVVPAVIQANTQKHSSDHIAFQLYGGNPADLPAADLLIVKDVLQHLPNQTIQEMLPHLSRFKYALITNCINPAGITKNQDIKIGDFRYLDLRLPPFNLQAAEVYSFTHDKSFLQKLMRRQNWFKVVLLTEGKKISRQAE